MLLERFYRNHVLANLAFVLVLVVGFLAYRDMPRQQDPTINFNWIVIKTVLPGASATDIEKRVTDPLETAVRKVDDIKFVSSTSREGVSNILLRFRDIDERTFDKRVTDLRREIQNKRDELPADATEPQILEITSANAYPTLTLAVIGQADDENLRYQASQVKKDLERLAGVDRVETMGLDDPELQVRFDMEKLAALGVSPVTLAETLSAWFRDVAAGSLRVEGESWLVRLSGTRADPVYLESLPLMGTAGEVPLGEVARVVRGREKAVTEARVEGRPAVVVSVMKEAGANTIDLIGRIREYMEERNRHSARTGVDLAMIDDQTVPTREAIRIMQTNALLGLVLVLAVTWVFLGTRIALLVSIGIPFILAGTFWVLSAAGYTLNVIVLLGTVISLGMLVDDAVVVVEAMYYRLQRGVEGLQAALGALREVAAPVSSAVLTTMAAFLPLMLLPGILGDFMRVIPLVVTTALAISLVEAFWMLPAHVLAARVGFRRPGRIQRWRQRLNHRIRTGYVRLLLRVLRYPRSTLAGLGLLFVLAAWVALGTDAIKKDFFAADPLRLFYVNVEMPPGSSLETTLAKVEEIERKVRRRLEPGEVRGMVAYAGQMYTQMEPFLGEQYGQIMVGLMPLEPGMRSVDDIIESMRAEVQATPGPTAISFLRLAGGPPTAMPISIKVRGDDFATLKEAADRLKGILAGIEGVTDITDDLTPGTMELELRLDRDAVRRAGVHPGEVARALRLLVDGEVVASMQHRGEELNLRLLGREEDLDSIEQLLDYSLPLAGGGSVPLRSLFHVQKGLGPGSIRHYNFRRTITVEADIDRALTDTVTANREVMARWREAGVAFPNIDLDFSGELDDIEESIDAIAMLFVLGVGLMYLIVGTQFRSYFQPLMILVTVPMAFTGVVLGLLINRDPLSLYTLYGVVALAGIAVNSAIVLISAANDRLQQGMSLLHATIYAARRRVIPILITSLTTVAGLFSLAAGLGGSSLIWGPVATAIVWGLVFSTVLTLLVVPLLYRLSMGRRASQ